MLDAMIQTGDFLDFEPIDGVHELRQRSESRLWYRVIQPESVPLTRSVRPAQAPPVAPPAVAAPPLPIADQLAEIARIAIAAGKRAGAQIDRPEPKADSIDTADWVIVPASCPALMLSASPTLGGQIAEAHLAPGVRFRVASIANGIAEIEVLQSNGAVRGYCNTVDLACADPNRLSARPLANRLRKPITARFKIGIPGPSFGGLR